MKGVLWKATELKPWTSHSTTINDDHVNTLSEIAGTVLQFATETYSKILIILAIAIVLILTIKLFC